MSKTTVASEAIATKISNKFLTELGDDAKHLSPLDREIITAASLTVANNAIALFSANAGDAAILQQEITAAADSVSVIGFEIGLETRDSFVEIASGVVNEGIGNAVKAAVDGLHAEINKEIEPIPANAAAIEAQKAAVAAREVNHNQRVENRKAHLSRQEALKEGRLNREGELNPDGSPRLNPVPSNESLRNDPDGVR